MAAGPIGKCAYRRFTHAHPLITKQLLLVQLYIVSSQTVFTYVSLVQYSL